MTRLIAFSVIIFLCSCSASWHLKKARRIDPTLFKTDTIVRVDTVVITIPKIDTLFRYKFDTVEYWKDSVYVKYHYDTLNNDVYIEVDCPDNKVITKTETITETIEIQPTFFEQIKYSLVGLAIISIILLVIRYTKR